MKYCTNCGQELPNEAKFCSACGGNQQNEPTENSKVGTSNNHENNDEEILTVKVTDKDIVPPRQTRAKRIFAVVGMFFLVFITTYIFFGFFAIFLCILLGFFIGFNTNFWNVDETTSPTVYYDCPHCNADRWLILHHKDNFYNPGGSFWVDIKDVESCNKTHRLEYRYTGSYDTFWDKHV